MCWSPVGGKVATVEKETLCLGARTQRYTCPPEQEQITNGMESAPAAGQVKVWQPAVACSWMDAFAISVVPG